MRQRTGGCLCGSVRYRVVGEPIAARVCWCRTCQRIAGNGTVNAIFPSEAVEIDGEPGEFTSAADSGNDVRRRFCARCGSHLFAENTGRARFMVVRVGTLDDPGSIAPTVNMWRSSAPAWACLDPTLQQADRQPPPPPPAA